MPRILLPIGETILTLGLLPIIWFDHERVPWLIWAAMLTCACLMFIADTWGEWAKKEIEREEEMSDVHG